MPRMTAVVDQCRNEIHAAGWKASETQVRENARLVWLVKCERPRQIVYTRHPRRARAWRAAVDLVSAAKAGRRAKADREQLRKMFGA